MPQDNRNGPRSGPDVFRIRYRGRADTQPLRRCRHGSEYPGSRPLRQADPQLRREHHTADAFGPCHFYPHSRVTAQGEDVLAAAQAAIDIDRFPGFAEFTSGVVTVTQADGERIVMTTDNRWAATAIRTALRRAGYAVEGDSTNETTTVTVWATSESGDEAQPSLELTEERDQYGRTVFLLEGPVGTVEQRCGSGGHNELIVHALHPFSGAARVRCSRHSDGCWQRADWPLEARVRHLFQSVMRESGSAWSVSPEASEGMRSLYMRHVHQSVPGSSLPGFRVFAPAPHVPAPRNEEPSDRRVTTPAHYWVVDVIPDLADFGASEGVQVT